MTRQRSFNNNILVVNGIPDGLRLVEKSNWTGMGIVSPRGRYSEAKKREKLSQSGGYLLVGNDESLLSDLYLGEAEEVRSLLNSDSVYENKEFWQEMFVFASRGTSLNKAQVKYLEANLIALAKKSCRSNLTNKQTPKSSLLPEADQAGMVY